MKKISLLSAAIALISLMSLGLLHSERISATPQQEISSVASILATDRPVKTDRDQDGHALVDRWKAYQEAGRKDLPESQATILSDILETARRQRQAWDFYDAACKLQEVTLRKDWKKRAEASERLEHQIREFKEPLLDFLYQYDYGNLQAAASIVREKADQLRKGQHPEIYTHAGKLSPALNGHLSESISDDYEYTLWILSERNSSEWGPLLETYLGDRYPNAEWYQLKKLDQLYSPYDFQQEQRTARRTALEKFVAKNVGNALSFYAREKLIFMDLEDARRNQEEKEEAFLRIDRDCKKLLSDRKRMKRSEKQFYGKPNSILQLVHQLESPALRIELKGRDSVLVFFRNLSSAQLSIYQEKEQEKKLLSTARLSPGHTPFYIEVEIAKALPRMDDGSYTFRVEKGKTSHEMTASYHTLSLAQRTTAEGCGIYVTEDETGKPIRTADLHLFKNGKEVAVEKDFKLGEGFTPLPDSWGKWLQKDQWYEMAASARKEDGTLRKSDALYLPSAGNHTTFTEQPETYGTVLTDQGAYRPGETVHFKALLYQGRPTVSYHTLSEGAAAKAEIMDTENQLLAERTLVTDAFGAAAGEFTLPRDARNGQFILRIRKDGKTLCYHPFRVDEFVLPEFRVEFAPQEEAYAPGDEIKVKGTVKSYSGHPMSGTQARYQVFNYGKQMADGRLELDDSGEFRIRFTSLSQEKEYGTYYHIRLKVIGNTGETHEYHQMVYVSGRLYLRTRILNERPSELSLSPSFQITAGADSHPLYNCHLVTEDEVRLQCDLQDMEQKELPLTYVLRNEKGDTLQSGNFLSANCFKMDLKEQEDGLYLLNISTQAGRKHLKEGKQEIGILKLSGSATPKSQLPAPIQYLFSAYHQDLATAPDHRFGAWFGSSEGETWAVAELYGENRRLLESRMIHLHGASQLADLSFEFKEDYPDIVTLQVFYFKNRRSQSFKADFKKPQRQLDLPLEWASFQDQTLPGKHYTFTLQTLPGAQCVAAIYDKSLDEIQPNHWKAIRLKTRYPEEVSIRRVCGATDILSGWQNGAVLRQGLQKYACVTRSDKVMEEAEGVMDDAMTHHPDLQEPDLDIRSNFATSLTFQPFLQADEAGQIRLEFDTSDQLSTFVVSLFAHTQDLKNEVLRKDFIVSVPLQIAVAEPAFLYDGDEWKMKVALSSNLEKELAGTLTVEQFAGTANQGKRPLRRNTTHLHIPAHGNQEAFFTISALKGKVKDSLGLKITFRSDDRLTSDGIFLKIPVHPSRQTILESHSALLQPGQDQKALYRELRSRFTNGSGSGARSKEINLMDLLEEAIPTHVHPQGKDLLSYADALYIQIMAQALGIPADGAMGPDQLLDKILDNRNQDGGFGWLEGMHSSPIMTATLLERFAKLEELAQHQELTATCWPALSEKLQLDASVHYLDQCLFEPQWPLWCGNLSLPQYLLVRSRYPQVSFSPELTGSTTEMDRQMKDFKEQVRHYLVPERERGLEGRIYEKARRLLTLAYLEENEAGISLAEAWGIRSAKKIILSQKADVASLLEYAVQHKDGGWYYPNLVQPSRGLLESEAYAHALMAELLDRYSSGQEIADGIRLWLMIQKESQHWEEEPGYIDAIHAVMNGSDELKATSLLVLTQRYEKAFSEIQSAGNGMSVERKFYKEEKDSEGHTRRVEVNIGTPIFLGDHIVAVYQIHNDENRSFGKLTARREAGLTPVDPMSGNWHWGIRPLQGGLHRRYQPTAYRDVHADRTVYYLEVMPEEEWEIQEEFFVTRAGKFQAPAMEIESTYAPQYRANTKGSWLTVDEKTAGREN